MEEEAERKARKLMREMDAQQRSALQVTPPHTLLSNISLCPQGDPPTSHGDKDKKSQLNAVSETRTQWDGKHAYQEQKISLERAHAKALAFAKAQVQHTLSTGMHSL